MGGRYKVTGHVLASADDDMVLDGIDQVLNRPVSILLASPANASQMTASARELATGERPGNIQVLDLGISEEHTYLVTSQAQPADLLDLVIEQNKPYIEPFFTDTLGSEIFGHARSTEPMVYDDDDDYYEEQARKQGSGRKSQPQSEPPRQESPRTAPIAPTPPASRPSTSSRDDTTEQRQSRFPAGALSGGAAYSGGNEDEYDEYDEPPAERGNKVRRGLIGAVFAAIVVVAVVLAVSNLGNLGNLFNADPVAGDDQNTSAPAESGTPTPTPSSSESETSEEQEAVAPEIVGLTRLVPNNPELNSGSDADLPKLIDNNPASYWQSFVFANDTFGGLAQSMALVVKLQEPSSINQVEITQLNGAGGNFEVLLNETPTLEGARQVAQSSFTGTTLTLPVSTQDGNTAKAQYVIVNFTQLPRLSGIQAEFPWGLRIAEIKVS
nr:ABC transporter substrate-binding protein [Arthrobacter roseus]